MAATLAKRTMSLAGKCRILAAVLAAGFAGVEGVAQEPLTPPPTELYLRWGSLFARPALNVLNVGRNSNVFATPEEEAVADYQATFAPRLQGLLFFGDVGFLTFSEEISYTAYAENSELNFFNQRGWLRTTFPLQGFGFFSEVRFDRIRLNPVDLDDIRPVEQLFRVDLGVVVELASRSYFQYILRYSDYKNGDDDLGNVPIDIAELLDRVERGDIIEFGYDALSRTRFTVRGEHQKIEFDRPNVLEVPGFDRNSRLWKVLPGVTLGDRGSLLGTIQIGWARLDHVGEAIEDYDGPIGEAILTYRPGHRTRLDWEAWRRIGFAVSSFNNYLIDINQRIGAVHFFNAAFGLDAQIDIGRVEIPAQDRVDDVTSYRLGVRLKTFQNAMGRRVEYGLSVGRYERDSTLPSLNRSRNTLLFNAHIGY